MSKRKFKWGAWDFDCSGDSYIIAKDECPNIEDVPGFICTEEFLRPDSNVLEDIRKDIGEGWAKYQIRRDWENCEGESSGGYYVTPFKDEAHHDGKRRGGWFPVWIVRKGEWY